MKGALTVNPEGTGIIGQSTRVACHTCERKSYKAGGLLRCMDWKRFSTIASCSNYIGPHASCHFKIEGGREYHDTLAHARLR
jgi:hypothetical protein